MKILLLANRIIESSEEITTFSEMWIYNLRNSLIKAGVEVGIFPRFKSGEEQPHEYVEALLKAAKGYDCILAPGVRYFTQIPLEVGDELREKFGGVVAHIYDGSLLGCPQVDVTYTLRNDDELYRGTQRWETHKEKNIHVGWAANESLFYPEQDPDAPLRIFMDHTAFNEGSFDYTLTILMNLRQLAKDHKVVVRTLTDEGIVEVDLSNNPFVKQYNRVAVPATEFAAELRKADIFIVTHGESLGQTVLEAARCGALVITPPGCISEDRLNTVKHYKISSKIDWDDVLSRLDIQGSYEKAAEHTWDKVAANIINDLKERV